MRRKTLLMVLLSAGICWGQNWMGLKLNTGLTVYGDFYKAEHEKISIYENDTLFIIPSSLIKHGIYKKKMFDPEKLFTLDIKTEQNKKFSKEILVDKYSIMPFTIDYITMHDVDDKIVNDIKFELLNNSGKAIKDCAILYEVGFGLIITGLAITALTTKDGKNNVVGPIISVVGSLCTLLAPFQLHDAGDNLKYLAKLERHDGGG